MLSQVTKARRTYPLEWFKTRAINSIKPMHSGSWDFSDSLLLYAPKAIAIYEEIQKDGMPYYDLITKPETEFISKTADEIARELPATSYYIDLGPGTEHKERFFFQSLQAHSKSFIYFPVDISRHILDGAEAFAHTFNITTNPILAPFEECGRYLPNDGTYRFVSLGLTFINYHMKDILNLLRNIIGVRGSCFITAHVRERVDIEKIKKLYVQDVQSIIEPKMHLLGLNPHDISNIQVNDKIEIWWTIKNPTPELTQKGIKNGDRILVLQSLRYSLDELKNEVPKVFKNYQLIDIGSSFVGFLLKKP